LPLTDFQEGIARLLSANRTPDSYLAGGAALHIEPNSRRYSNDLDYFHDSEQRVASAFADDRQLLSAHGYEVEVFLQQPGFVRALARRGADATKIEWAHDSAWRFLPPIRSERAGFVLHPVDLAITADAADLIAELEKHDLGAAQVAERKASIAKLQSETGFGILPQISVAQGTVHHVDLVAAVQSMLGPDDLITLDAGANRIWATYGLRTTHAGQLLVPGGTGAMGWGTAAAVAAKLTLPHKRVTALTAVQRNLDVVFLVSNNAGLGMVRDNLGDDRYAVDFAECDFARIAEGFGARGLTVTHPDQVRSALDEAHRMGGAVVIDAKVDPDASHHGAVDNAPL